MSTSITPSASRCFACSPDHPTGLRLNFQSNEDTSAETQWCPAEQWEGYRGVTHGGIVSTVLDEAMAKAIAVQGLKAVTGELRVRYRAPVCTGVPYSVRGWIVEQRRGVIEAEATVKSADGTELAHGWGVFAAMR